MTILKILIITIVKLMIHKYKFGANILFKFNNI